MAPRVTVTQRSSTRAGSIWKPGALRSAPDPRPRRRNFSVKKPKKASPVFAQRAPRREIEVTFFWHKSNLLLRKSNQCVNSAKSSSLWCTSDMIRPSRWRLVGLDFEFFINKTRPGWKTTYEKWWSGSSFSWSKVGAKASFSSFIQYIGKLKNGSIRQNWYWCFIDCGFFYSPLIFRDYLGECLLKISINLNQNLNFKIS